VWCACKKKKWKWKIYVVVVDIMLHSFVEPQVIYSAVTVRLLHFVNVCASYPVVPVLKVWNSVINTQMCSVSALLSWYPTECYRYWIFWVECLAARRELFWQFRVLCLQNASVGIQPSDVWYAELPWTAFIVNYKDSALSGPSTLCCMMIIRLLCSLVTSFTGG